MGDGSQKSEIPCLTGLRGIAALWVFVFHAWTMSGQDRYLIDFAGLTLDFTPYMLGWVGIDILFVLSGFLLFLPYARHMVLGEHPPLSYLSYMKRRLLRIAPAYWIQLIILLILFLLGLYLADATLFGFFLHTFFLQNLAPQTSLYINGVYWTLAIEMNFYLILPALFMVIHKLGWTRSYLLVLLLMIGYRTLSYHLTVDVQPFARTCIREQLPGRLDQFFAGMFAAWCYARTMQTKYVPSIYLRISLIIIGFATIMLVQYLLSHPQKKEVNYMYELYLVHYTLGIVAAGIVYSLCFGGKPLQRIFANRAILWIGIISYSLYLWHLPIMHYLLTYQSSVPRKLAEIGGKPAVFFAILIIALVISSLSYILTEKPFLKLRSKHLKTLSHERK